MTMDSFSLLATNLVLVLVLFAGLWTLAQMTRDPSFVDAFWAYGITVLAISSFFLADGWEPRRQVITALVAIWGLRLGTHLFLRWRADGADPRYEALLASARKQRSWPFWKTTALFVFLPQAGLLWITALPAQLGQIDPTPGFGLLACAGLALAVFGIAFETVADTQLAVFRRKPGNAGKVMDQGVWGWSRHPNYFGEAVTWWGIWLIAAETTPGLFALAGPVFVTFTLTRWSGAPMLEKGLKKRREGYDDYIARTSGFIPWPPKPRQPGG
jgi:steroid 5-alpha reductase family enzyme